MEYLGRIEGVRNIKTKIPLQKIKQSWQVTRSRPPAGIVRLSPSRVKMAVVLPLNERRVNAIGTSTRPLERP
ncbi:hypothetical protein GFL95_15325 [Rhizobium leguminosarum bv. viciae]|nr:hypothetical protein [Rhizobium leguminosarum bv. viciae]